MALSFSVAAQAIGGAIGFVIPTIFVKEDDTNEEFKTHIQQALLLQAIFGVLCGLACVIFFRNQPPSPPSPTAFDRVDEPGMFKKSIVTLLTDGNLWLLFGVFGLIQGSFNTFGTIVGYLGDSFGYTTDQSSLFGALFIVGGIVGCVVFSIWLEKTLAYKKALITVCFLSSLLILVTYFIMPNQEMVASCITFVFLGFSMIPILATSFDFGVEITYPIGESYSTGLLMSSS
mmetsp:Transcript_21902/g.34020  ORF Transcript_21902/g.34020 Transcript_21902/m.34020 type:complete len:231 (+) Transcript_21902:805-1497(+)|eukprot:CAMPEP_0170496810 /NCGR_PEP_ID=MMETSP0208-20121228/22752_1 /TAXON_ID=197538 /ORGANISM="Strombidium inclinatum, Strain S3" /LENGTH=230 /DNA_ID=CAMNT_0010773441 /DNA_START=724 /DNA_END=1416 /DNA_ORIENTATION=+